MRETFYDVAALGEVLIDLTQTGKNENGDPVFAANPGGAPANVLAMLSRLGRRCAFLGKAGRDSFGDHLAGILSGCGIDTAGLCRDDAVPTTLAVVHTLPGGDRDFSFYRSPGADMTLRPEELDRRILSRCRVFHFGSLSLTDEPCRSATHEAVALARSAGAMISYDPNFRPPLWPDDQTARQQIEWGLAQCDILKIADNELRFVCPEDDPDRAAETLMRRFPNVHLMNVTCGADGSRAYCSGLRVSVPAFRLGSVIDTTGAGDAFCGCVLDYVLAHGLNALCETDLREMLRFANAAGYLVSTKRGAIRSMPDRSAIEAVLSS